MSRDPLRQLLLFILGILFPWSVVAGDMTVAQALARLAREYHFKVIGLETLEDAPARIVTGGIHFRLKRLLEDSNYILLQKPDGGIERVIVFGAKAPIHSDRPLYFIAGPRKQWADPVKSMK